MILVSLTIVEYLYDIESYYSTIIIMKLSLRNLSFLYYKYKY